MSRWQRVPRARVCAAALTRWRAPAPQCVLREQTRLCHSMGDEYKYLELKQLRDIKSEEFYDLQGQHRRYFYYIDLQGRLFLENTRPKNIATSLKSAKFLKFFFSQIRPNGPPAASDKDRDDAELFLEYPYRSPCGKEMNFIKCADRPFVFEDLHQDEETGQWVFAYGGGALKAPFDPTKLKISLTTGRLYHDLRTKYDTDAGPSVALVKSQLAVELGKHVVVHDTEEGSRQESAAGAEMLIGEIEWQEQRFPIKAIERKERPQLQTAFAHLASPASPPAFARARRAFPLPVPSSMSALPAPRPPAYSRSSSSECDDQASLGRPRMPVLVDSPRHKDAEDAATPVVVVSPNVTKGNRLVQFMVFSAVTCTLYQFVIHGSSQLTMKTDTTVGAQFGSSEYTCILACMGLFGLIRHKAKEAKKRAVDEEVEDEDDELTRELRLTEKLVRNQRKHTGKHERVAVIKRTRQSSTNACKNAVAGADGLCNKQGIETLPLDVLHELLLFLPPKDLATCPMVSKQMNVATGDASDSLWRLVFQRDFMETGERFQVVFPIESWRQFYFQHHLSRAVEIARLLGLEEDKKCVAIEDRVYDVTTFLHSHPGGYHVIGDVIGTDATEIWDQFQHSQEAKESMKEFMVDDPILCDREAHPRLRGNLAIVITRWQRISWCIANAHNFGPMASTFTDVVLRFHARSIKKSRDLATPRVSK